MAKKIKENDTQGKYEVVNGLIELLSQNNCLDETCIYVNNECYEFFEGSGSRRGGVPTTRNGHKCFLVSNITPEDYFEYANPNMIAVSFDGSNLYSELNYDHKMTDKLYNFFKQYGLYFELGNAWNFSVYED